MFIRGPMGQLWHVGNGDVDNNNNLRLSNHKQVKCPTGLRHHHHHLIIIIIIIIRNECNFSNHWAGSTFRLVDARYYNKSSADNRYLRVRSTDFNTSGAGKWAKIATVNMPQAPSTAVIELFGGAGFGL